MAKSKVVIRTSQDIQDWDEGISFDPKDPASASQAVQSQRDECDINNIVKKYVDHGIPLPLAEGAEFLDVSEIGDYHDSLNKVLQAQELFDALPASVRARFNNDPGEFVEFASDTENNIEELGKLGLAKPEAVAAAIARRQKAAESEAEAASSVQPGGVKGASAPSGQLPT